VLWKDRRFPQGLHMRVLGLLEFLNLLPEFLYVLPEIRIYRDLIFYLPYRVNDR
jgi:hypothetical protein